MFKTTLYNFLREKTKDTELCIICDNGWRSAACWVDHEDLFLGSLPKTMLEMEVKKDSWETLEKVDGVGKKCYTMAHYIYI